MAKRKFQLTDSEMVAFRQAEEQTRDVRERKRLQAVRLYGMGETVETIQKLVGCGPVSPAQGAIESTRRIERVTKSLARRQCQEVDGRTTSGFVCEAGAIQSRTSHSAGCARRQRHLLDGQRSRSRRGAMVWGELPQSTIVSQPASCQRLELSEGGKSRPFATGSGAVSRL